MATCCHADWLPRHHRHERWFTSSVQDTRPGGGAGRSYPAITERGSGLVLSVPVDNVLRPVVEFMKGRGTCGM